MKRLVLILSLCASAFASAQTFPFIETSPGAFVSFDRHAIVSAGSRGVTAHFTSREGRPVLLRWSIEGAALELVAGDRSHTEVAVVYGNRRTDHRAWDSLESALPEGRGRLWLRRRPAGVEYGLHLSSPASLKGLRFVHEGALEVKSAEDGSHWLRIEDGTVHETAPRCAQLQMSVPCRFTGLRREEDGRYTYEIEAPTASPWMPLEVDPVYEWSRFLGTEQLRVNAVSARQNKSQVVYAATSRIPLDGGTQPAPDDNILVGWLNADGGHERLLTIGGDGTDIPNDVKVRYDGFVAMVGSTTSGDYPAVPSFYKIFGNNNRDAIFTFIKADGTVDATGYVQSSAADAFNGVAFPGNQIYAYMAGTFGAQLQGFPSENQPLGLKDAVVVRVLVANPTTTRVARYYGGGHDDELTSITVSDADDRIVLAGRTRSTTFDAGAFDPGLPYDQVFVDQSNAANGFGYGVQFFGRTTPSGRALVQFVPQSEVVWLAASVDYREPVSDAGAPPGTIVPPPSNTGAVVVGKLRRATTNAKLVPEWVTVYDPRNPAGGGSGEETVNSLTLDDRGGPVMVGTSSTSNVFNVGDFDGPVLSTGGPYLLTLRPEDGRVRNRGHVGAGVDLPEVSAGQPGELWVGQSWAPPDQPVPDNPIGGKPIDGGFAAMVMRLHVDDVGPNTEVVMDAVETPANMPLGATVNVTARERQLMYVRTWFERLGDTALFDEQLVTITDGGAAVSLRITWQPTGNENETWTLFAEGASADGYETYDQAGFNTVAAVDAGEVDGGVAEADAGTQTDGGVSSGDDAGTATEPVGESPIGFTCGSCSATGGSVWLLLALFSATAARRRRS